MAPKGTLKTVTPRNKHSSKSESATQSAPDWPAFQHLSPATDLSLVPLLEDQIIIIPTFWTAGLCKTYVNFLSTLPLTTTPGKPKRGDAVRVNDRYQIDNRAFAERLWSGTALKELVEHPRIDDDEAGSSRALDAAETKQLWGGEVLGLNSNIRIYRYSKGQFFDQHCPSSQVSPL